jgi:hypothetical protein
MGSAILTTREALVIGPSLTLVDERMRCRLVVFHADVDQKPATKKGDPT